MVQGVGREEHGRGVGRKGRSVKKQQDVDGEMGKEKTEEEE